MGFALGPALATLVWAASSYGVGGMRGAVILAAAFSALSVLAVVQTRGPAKPEEAPQKQPEAQEEITA
jgi:hypothetical protein